MPNYKFNTVVLLAILSLTGCGLKGPLYFPEKSTPLSAQKKPAPSKTVVKPATPSSSESH
jgi:predicted small lipoprotein YifL